MATSRLSQNSVLQTPLPNGALKIVACGQRQDGGENQPFKTDPKLLF
jgi:hypothetical protein